MASKTFSGQLDQAMNEAAAEGNKILFIPQQTVGEVLPGAASELVVESDGTYSIKLAYNTYSIYHYSDVTKRKTLLATDIVVSTDTAVTTIPDLLGSVVPVTEDSVLTIQGYLDEANEAKTDAETAQAATEALFDDFDSSVADSVSPLHADTPSLSAPFNESGRLDYGVGTEYVSGLPVYGVDFTRSTTSTVINKSGALETLAVDEAGIGADGIWLHGAYTNLTTYSQDFTQWPGVASVDAILQSSDFWSDDETLLTVNSDASTVGIRRKSSNFSSDITSYTYYAVVKKGTSQTAYLAAANGVLQTAGCSASITFNFDTEALSVSPPDDADISSGFTQLTGGYYLIWFSVYDCSGVSSGANNMDVGTASDVEGETVIFVLSQCVENSAAVLPYTPTTSATASTAATVCTLPVSGNLPAVGDSFTFVLDAEFNGTNEMAYDVFSVTSDTSGGVILFRKNASGYVQWYHDKADGTDSNIATNNTAYTIGRHRYSLTFNGSAFAMYCDGELVASLTSDDYCWFDVDGYIYFDPSYRNQLKNFKILPYAASADEVKSWGAPK